MQTLLKHTDLKRFVSNDGTRPAMKGVYLDVERKCLIATNGHVLACIPVTIDEGDVSAIIPLEAFDPKPLGVTGAAIELFRVFHVGADEITVRSTSGASMTHKPIEEQYPNYSAILDPLLIEVMWERSGVNSIGFDLAYVEAIQKIIPRDSRRGAQVTFRFTRSSQAAVVNPVDPEYADWTFLLMPVLIEPFELAHVEESAEQIVEAAQEPILEDDYVGDSMPAEPEVVVSEASFEIEEYSDKAIVLRGDTKPIKERLKELRGRFNPHLHGGAGWIFSRRHEADVRSFVSSL